MLSSQRHQSCRSCHLALARLHFRALRRYRPEWRLNPDAAYTQLSFPQCDLSKLPKDLKDGQGRLAAPSGPEQKYALPPDLQPDDLDRDAEERAKAAAAKHKARLKALEEERKAAEEAQAKAAKEAAEAEAAATAATAAATTAEPKRLGKAASPRKSGVSDGVSEESDEESSDQDSASEVSDEDSDSEEGSSTEDEESEGEENDDLAKSDEDELLPIDPKPKGKPCVSIRLGSNNIQAMDPQALKGVPHLRSLDMTTNHLESFVLAPDVTPRLMTLSLRNNQLTSLGGITAHTLLRHLDVSFNRLTTLDGLESLGSLRVLLATGNRLSGALPYALSALPRLLVLDLACNEFDSPSVEPLSGLTDLSTLRLAHNKLPTRALPEIAEVVSRLSLLRRLELFGNPVQSDPSYPDALLKAQPSLAQVEHQMLSDKGASLLPR